MNTTKIWDGQLYDRAQAFVSNYGLSLIELIPSGERLRILDLGCGTGDLSKSLHGLGHQVLGVDSSAEMVAQAQQKYPELDFAVVEAIALPYVGEFDIVFSNAVFHWINEQDQLLAGIRRALKVGGMLVAEFGAQGNIAKVQNAFEEALVDENRHYSSPFYFPSVEVYQAKLEEQGYQVASINDYDRPTPLPHGQAGLRQWVAQFFSKDFEALSSEAQDRVIARMEARLAPQCWQESTWVLDYRRLRLIAFS